MKSCLIYKKFDNRYLNFADELDYRLDNDDFEVVVELILVKEVINR